MENQAPKPGREELVARAKQVDLIVLDVDGVLTDGGLYYGSSGEALKRFDVKDGHGIVMGRLTGLSTAILTARTSEAVSIRGQELGCVRILQGRRNKGEALLQLLQELKTPPERCAYMGDDVNDLRAMSLVGLPACPADAALETRQHALFIAQQPGGRGAVRELFDICLRASGRMEKALELMNPSLALPPVD